MTNTAARPAAATSRNTRPIMICALGSNNGGAYKLPILLPPTEDIAPRRLLAYMGSVPSTRLARSTHQSRHHCVVRLQTATRRGSNVFSRPSPSSCAILGACPQCTRAFLTAVCVNCKVPCSTVFGCGILARQVHMRRSTPLSIRRDWLTHRINNVTVTQPRSFQPALAR
jgi:hypothetical protein